MMLYIQQCKMEILSCGMMGIAFYFLNLYIYICLYFILFICSMEHHLYLNDGMFYLFDRMALSLDDKILGEKTHYYCSSSEEDDGDDEREPVDPKGIQFIPESELQENTGNGATYAAMNVSAMEFDHLEFEIGNI